MRNKGLLNQKKRFLLAAAIPFLILLAMTIKPEATVLFGQEILLETRAVDPTDLFRGDYVSVNFAISEIPKTMLPEPLQTIKNKNLYISLRQEGKIYVVDKVSEVKPKQGVYLKGKIQDPYTPLNTYHMDYSLDKYFVRQGTGEELQKSSNAGGLIGTVRVLGGYGVITGLAKS